MMESLAYIHITLEYEKSLQAESKDKLLAYQYQLKNPPIKVYLSHNLLLAKLGKSLSKRQKKTSQPVVLV